MRHWLLVGCGLLLSANCFVACGGEDEEGEEELPAVVCSSAPVPGFGEVTAFSQCIVCHDSAKTGAERQGAKLDVNYDTYEAAKATALKAAEEVHEGAMPPKSSGLTLTDAEKDALYRWAQCGTPEFATGAGGDAGSPDGG